VQVHDERDATGVVLEGGVVEALRARKVSIGHRRRRPSVGAHSAVDLAV
jgi:hypothetical protein